MRTTQATGTFHLSTCLPFYDYLARLLSNNDERANVIGWHFLPDAFAIPSWSGPIKEPLCIRIGHIDTPVAHRMPKIIVPIGAVEAIVLIEILHPFDARQIVIHVAFAAEHGL